MSEEGQNLSEEKSDLVRKIIQILVQENMLSSEEHLRVMNLLREEG